MKVIIHFKKLSKKDQFDFAHSIIENESTIGIGGEKSGAILVEKKSIKKIVIKF